MAEDSEKRFHAIMDKLFYAPRKPKSSQSNSTKSTSLSGVQSSRGIKRPNMSTALAVPELKSRGSVAERLRTSSVSGGVVQAPLCRPWDRGDLQKRLATFKSMTWFAKPEVVSAVNCARRGWVNVDSDTIACEACGSRLFFSTPSSWTHHQVEKAALVFSLKLDNGHKSLCPWVDNACDEGVAQFPPMPAAVLVDNYKKRYAALMQLLALPVISSSAIDCIRSPQLDHFLNESSSIEVTNKSANASTTDYLGQECEDISSIIYYQAHKLISLCGWEPRSLPYFVDYEDQEDLALKDVNISDPPSSVSNRHNPHISIYSSESNEQLEANDDPMAPGAQFDPSSVVLDCRLCGASVGLWTFSTTPRPVEFVRLVGEVNGENNAGHNLVIHTDNGDSGTHDLGNESHFEANTSKDGTSSLDKAPPSLNLTIAGGPPPAKQNFRPTISLPVIGRNLRVRLSTNFELRPDAGQCNPTSNDPLQCLGSEISEQCETLRDDNDCNMILEGASSSERVIPETDRPESIMNSLLENTPSVAQSSIELYKLPENEAIVVRSGPGVDLCNSQSGNSAIPTSGGHKSLANSESSMNDTLMMVAVDNCYVQRSSGSEIVCSKQGLDMKQSSVHKRMEFDPFRQHRHFCPWITSSGSSPPGWQQTLSALQRQNEFSSPSTHSPSSSLIEVDDPVGSVKKLFMSPSRKRAKIAHGLS